MNLHEVSPRLLDELRDLGEDYGPLGVALAAAQLTDPALVVRHLTMRPVDDGRPVRTGRGRRLLASFGFGRPDL